MRILKGIAVSNGIGIAKALVYNLNDRKIIHIKKEASEVANEKIKFEKAIKHVSRTLTKLMKDLEEDEKINIIETHLLMVKDPEFNKAVVQEIENLKGVEWAITSVIDKNIDLLNSLNDASLNERIDDFRDIENRLLETICGSSSSNFGTDLTEKTVLVANNMLPSHMLNLDIPNIEAIALDEGGRTSHVAILARSLGIPTIVGLNSISRKTEDGDVVIVNASKGEVIIRPSKQVYDKNIKEQEDYNIYQNKLKSLAKLPSITKDGKEVQLQANIETLEELKRLKDYNCDSIGLFRSEFLFLKTGYIDSEELQFEIYKKVVTSVKKSVTIRTVDLGGDKIVPEFAALDESNPILGWRAIRFCLARKDIFSIQLRALLRASVYGDLRIMFPMISGIEELEDALEVLDNVKKELDNKKIPYNKNIKIGTMIEIPSAALCSDIISQKVDFLSIGTNDLIQYTIAVDRQNEKTAYLYQPMHPAVLKLISMVIENGHKANIEVGMCGEMASHPQALALLIAMKLDKFSMNLQSLSQIKYFVRQIDTKDLEEFKNKVLALNSYKEINEYVRKWMDEKFDYSNY